MELRKIKIAFLAFIITLPLIADSSKKPLHSFNSLSKHFVNSVGIIDADTMQLWYNPALVNFIDKQISNKNISEAPEFIQEYFKMQANDYKEFSLIAQGKFDGENEYYMCFSCWPNGEVYIFREGLPDPIGIIGNPGVWVIPGNGTLYNSSRTAYHPKREKYDIRNDSVILANQEFWYIGMKTKTLKEVKVYETQNCENLLATLPPGYEIEILLNNKESLNLIKEESLDMRHPVFGSVPCFSMPYFVRTSFGLCGWARLRLCQYMEYDIEGLMYNGD